MTLQQLQPIIDTSVATKTASSVLHRVFHEIKNYAQVTEYTDVWFEDGLNILSFSNNVEIGFMHSKIAMLAVFKEAWDKIPFALRRQQGYDFISFAKRWTDNKSKSTIDAYVATAKLWILDDYGAGRRIEIKERTPEGKPILVNGKQATKVVEFCPYTVDISKLTLLNPRARDNKMTDKLWEMLVDDFYSCDDIRAEHQRDKGDGNGPQYRPHYDLSGPALVYYQNGHAVVVAEELNWAEYETDPLVKESINTLLKTFSIRMDEDKIHDMIRNGWK